MNWADSYYTNYLEDYVKQEIIETLKACDFVNNWTTIIDGYTIKVQADADNDNEWIVSVGTDECFVAASFTDTELLDWLNADCPFTEDGPTKQ